MPHPLLSDGPGPHGLPDFAALSDADFAPAFEEAFALTRAAIDAVAADPAPPTFANTIAALERADQPLDRVGAVFWNLAHADSTEAREALARDLAPRLAAFRAETVMNRALFARIEALATGARTGLTAEEDRVLTLYHDMFVRSGARLEGAARERLKAVMERLATLGTRFSQNLLADERGWTLALGEATLATLPPFLADAARAAAAERGLPGAVLTLARSLVVPFLQTCPDRALRETAFRAWTARGRSGGETDNRAIAAEMLALRAERARLLGYPSFAALKLEREMARRPEAVRELLMQVWAPARAAALADAARLEALLHADGHPGPLEPWDWRYYAEKLRRAEYDLDEAELKPFLSLEGIRAAAFDVAGRLFGLGFRPVEAVLHHPDARAWEVTRGGRAVGLFIADDFARPSKRSGAWMSAFRSQSRFAGPVTPVVLNVCNIAKAPAGQPALLTFDDARTLFHEFGHALHGLLSDVTYPFVSGTSVARDFVELPSQLYEHWLEVPAILAAHARHHATGAPMPPDLLDRLLAARTFDQGFATVEYVASALVDLDLHAGDPPADPVQAEAATLDRIGMPRAILPRHATPHFAHLFSGDGYAAGYYSYMWSEVMDADAFDAFEETQDPFDAATAERLLRFVYAAGGARDPAELYMAFRGRLPGPAALLRRRGLAAAA